MKKILLTFILMLLAIGIIGCKTPEVPNDDKEKTENNLPTDDKDKTDDDLPDEDKKLSEEEIKKLVDYTHYFGCYKSQYVFLKINDTNEHTSFIIGQYVFALNDSFEIFLYSDKKVSLEEGYNQKLIDDEDILDIYNKFYEAVKDELNIFYNQVIDGHYKGKSVYDSPSMPVTNIKKNVFIEDMKYDNKSLELVTLKEDFFKNANFSNEQKYLEQLQNAPIKYYIKTFTSDNGLEDGYYIFVMNFKIYWFWVSYNENTQYTINRGFELTPISEEDLLNEAISTVYPRDDKLIDILMENKTTAIMFDPKSDVYPVEYDETFKLEYNIDFILENYYVLCYENCEPVYTKTKYSYYDNLVIEDNKIIIDNIYNLSTNDVSPVCEVCIFYSVIFIPKNKIDLQNKENISLQVNNKYTNKVTTKTYSCVFLEGK